ncbi:MAG: type II secretion system protein [Planctomycetota bacterium]|jgi:prepilin-type N-terminal cleavage/methylation domain-containing protein|nr:type II secretion system protein [Planctomycetota bacterium]
MYQFIAVSHRRTRGMTMIELVVVMAVMGILAGIASPSVASALNKGVVNRAGNEIQSVADEVRRRARSDTAPNPAAGAAHWGVALVQEPGSQPYAVVLYGTAASDEYQVNGIARRVPLGEVELRVGSAASTTPLDGRIAWFNTYLTGRPVLDPAQPLPTGLGVAAAPTGLQRIEVRGKGSTEAVLIKVFDLGLVAVDTP